MRINKLFIVLLITPILASCSNDSFHYREQKEIDVVLVSGEHYQVVDHDQKKDDTNINIAHLVSSNTVKYTIGVEKNYYVSGISYEDSKVFFIGNSQYSVVLNNVKYSTRVTVYVDQISGDSSEEGEPGDESNNEITYDANGGEYILVDGLPMNKTIYSTIHHPRPNTSIGTDIMYRDGYNLIGWNTKSDLSGEHIGLGSRYLDLNNHTFTLYAEWSKYTDKSNFTYHEVHEDEEDYVVIDKYIGSSIEVSIPEFIDGLPVKVIGDEAFRHSIVEKIVLPKSITNLGILCFGQSKLKELYFFDNLKNISDGCFMENNDFSTVHINAILPPRFSSFDRHSTYADKIDNLIVNKDKKKIIILGGSGAYYNVDACTLKKLYPDYEPFNVAINGWFNNYIQLDIIDKFIGENDVFLHVVESCGQYQFLTVNNMGYFSSKNGYDSRFFNALELNYDLISYADIRKVSNFFDVFMTFNNSRANREPKKYTDYTDYADRRGDYSSDSTIRKNEEPKTIYSKEDKTKIERNSSITQEGSVDTKCYSSQGMNKLLGYYQQFIDKGAKIYFAFACVAEQSLLLEEATEENIHRYEVEVRAYLSKKATFLNTMADALISVQYFADSDWHLKYEKAVEETIKLADSIGALE